MTTIRADELPEELTAREFLDSLDVSDEVVFVSNGEPRIVLVSPKMLEARRRAHHRLFALIDTIRERNPDADSDALLDELEGNDATAK